MLVIFTDEERGPKMPPPTLPGALLPEMTQSRIVTGGKRTTMPAPPSGLFPLAIVRPARVASLATSKMRNAGCRQRRCVARLTDSRLGH